MFQTSTDKVVDRTLNGFPVSAMIAQHQPVNCQAPVHLEGKDSFRLLECQETMRHQIGHIRLLADIRQFAEQRLRHGFIQKQDSVPIVAANLVAERVGGTLLVRTKDMIQSTGGFGHQLHENVIQYIVQIQIVKIKCATVEFRLLADLSNCDMAEPLLAHKFQQRVPDDLPSVAGPAIHLPPCFRVLQKISSDSHQVPPKC